MFITWVNHLAFHRREQLMAILFDVGFATMEQLIELTGWTENIINKQLKVIRMDKEETERSSWIETVFLPRIGPKGKSKAAYKLGESGLKYVQGMMQMDSRYKEAMPSQLKHFLGINDIVIRLLQNGVDRTQLEWGSQLETSAFVIEFWNRFAPNSEQAQKKRIARPDSLLFLQLTPTNKRRFWIEFDNNTEGTRKIEQKYHRYVNTITPKNVPGIHKKLNHPVIWVTTDSKRKRMLEQTWSIIQGTLYSKVGVVPTMYFFVEGEETEFLLNPQNLQANKDV